jgi:hypothetical protein
MWLFCSQLQGQPQLGYEWVAGATHIVQLPSVVFNSCRTVKRDAVGLSEVVT